MTLCIYYTCFVESTTAVVSPHGLRNKSSKFYLSVLTTRNSSVDEIDERYSQITITAWTTPSLWNFITPIVNFPVTFAHLIGESTFSAHRDFFWLLRFINTLAYLEPIDHFLVGNCNNNNNQYIYKQRQSHAMSQRRWLATAVIFRPSDVSLGFAETWTVIAPATAETLEGAGPCMAFQWNDTYKPRDENFIRRPRML